MQSNKKSIGVYYLNNIINDRDKYLFILICFKYIKQQYPDLPKDIFNIIIEYYYDYCIHTNLKCMDSKYIQYFKNFLSLNIWNNSFTYAQCFNELCVGGSGVGQFWWRNYFGRCIVCKEVQCPFCGTNTISKTITRFNKVKHNFKQITYCFECVKKI
jgi:hypothetical protein